MMSQDNSPQYSANGSNFKECDIDGDLMLLVGSNLDYDQHHQLVILVSSSVLRLASKPFRTMLSLQYKEGIELASELVVSLLLQL